MASLPLEVFSLLRSGTNLYSHGDVLYLLRINRLLRLRRLYAHYYSIEQWAWSWVWKVIHVDIYNTVKRYISVIDSKLSNEQSKPANANEDKAGLKEQPSNETPVASNMKPAIPAVDATKSDLSSQPLEYSTASDSEADLSSGKLQVGISGAAALWSLLPVAVVLLLCYHFFACVWYEIGREETERGNTPTWITYDGMEI